MSLDLEQVAAQIAEMAETLEARRADRDVRLNFALNTMRSLPDDIDKLKKKYLKSENTQGGS